MHLLLFTLAVLLPAGNVVSLPVKGGEKGANAKGGQWSQPKDWDWSVTTSSLDGSSTSRLIPVSEATDDLPTPGYKMSDLQQRVLIVPSVIKLNHAVFPKEGSQFQITDSINTPRNTNNEETTENNKQDKAEEGNESEEKNFQSLDTSQNVTIVKETVSLQTTSSTDIDTSKKTDQSNADHSTPQPVSQNEESGKEQKKDVEMNNENEEERVAVNEPPMVKVTLPEICSITGLGCKDRPSKPDREESTESSATQAADKIETDNPNQPPQVHDSTGLDAQTTDSLSETTKRSIESVLKDIEDSMVHDYISESNPQTEQTSQTSSNNPSEWNSRTDIQSNEKVELSGEEDKLNPGVQTAQDENIQKIEPIEQQVVLKNDEQILQTQIDDASIPQQQIEEAFIKKIDSFDSLEQHPVHENAPVLEDQVNVASSTIEEQKPLEHVHVQSHKEKEESEEKDDSSEEDKNRQKLLNHDDQKKLRNSEESDESIENDDTKLEQERNKNEKEVNRGEIDKHQETSEEEKKLLERENLRTDTEKEENRNPSIGDRITGYWRAATGFVSKALNI